MFLIAAIAAEVLATSSLRAATDAETAWPWWTAATAGYAAAFTFLYAALANGMSLASAYAIWSGAGVAITAAVSWLVFSDRLTTGALAGMALVIAGVVLIELYGKSGNGAGA